MRSRVQVPSLTLCPFSRPAPEVYLTRLRNASASIAVIASLALVLTVAGCGGGDDEATTTDSGIPNVQDAFSLAAAAAYEQEGKNREADFGAGTTVKECFALDEAGLEKVGEAAGVPDLEFTGSGFLAGPPDEEERLVCPTDAGKGAESPAAIRSIAVGLTLADREQLLKRSMQGAREATEIDGTAPGLDPESVFALDLDGSKQFTWVSDEFVVGLGGPSDELDDEAGFDALGVLVEEVQRTLAA